MSHAWILERKRKQSPNAWKPCQLCKTLREGVLTMRLHGRIDDTYTYRVHKYVRKL